MSFGTLLGTMGKTADEAIAAAFSALPHKVNKNRIKSWQDHDHHRHLPPPPGCVKKRSLKG